MKPARTTIGPRRARGRPRCARRGAGFTLIEVVLAMVLLGIMMLLLYSGLTFAMRSWDAAELAGTRATDQRIGANFLRRELGETFPMRWKEPTVLHFAFEGKAHTLRFVSSRPPGIQSAGLSLVGLSVEELGDRRRRDLVMRRAMPDDEAKDFGPLERTEDKPTVLIAGVRDVSFSYFGSQNDFSDPQWVEEWTWANRMPLMVRVRVAFADGTVMPEMLVRMMVGEEAGCLENSFQRGCRPRRAGT